LEKPPLYAGCSLSLLLFLLIFFFGLPRAGKHAQARWKEMIDVKTNGNTPYYGHIAFVFHVSFVLVA
jgi:hypothetical protein